MEAVLAELNRIARAAMRRKEKSKTLDELNALRLRIVNDEFR